MGIKKIKVGIVGGGNMGSAIISGIHRKYGVTVCEKDPKRCQFLKKKFGIPTQGLQQVIQGSRIIILAVKPQDFEGILRAARSFFTQNKLVISIAAGITTKYIEKRLPARTKVIRTMPNLPAQVGQAITAICKGKSATHRDLRLTRRIFDNIGSTIVVEEKWIDTITAVSGSGPAYVFLFVECFNKAARSLGLKKELAQQLVCETLKGSLKLLESQKEDAHNLRVQVTSKGGTTQAAMDVFEKYKLEKVFKEALKAAKKRARELEKSRDRNK